MELTRGRSGYTIVELVVALGISLIVVLALGRVMLVNQSSFRQGRDKVLLQQNASEALERMAHSIRAARELQLVSATEFRTYDASGALVHTYRRQLTAAGQRLLEDGQELSSQHCAALSCAANGDTTSLTISLLLENGDGEQVARQSRITLRNRTIAF